MHVFTPTRLKPLHTILIVLVTLYVASLLLIRYQSIQYMWAFTDRGFAHEITSETLKAPTLMNPQATCSSGNFKVLTYNVEYGSELIEEMATRFNHKNTGGALPWSVRSPEIRERITEYSPDLIGFQETHTDKDISTIISNENYSLVTYHMGGFQYGDAALAFNKHKFDLMDKGQLWLSNKPNLPMSFGFRTLSVFRYVNWAILKEKSTNFSFMFVNTHFDNSGVNKDPSALLFNAHIVALSKDIPMIVTGDFNTTAQDKRYRQLVGDDHNLPHLQNTFDLINHETVDSQSHPNSLSDHIFTGGPCKAHTDNWFIDHRPLKNGQRMSDHLPILTKIHFAA